MKITADILLLVFTIIPNFTELSSKKTLKELFPEYRNGDIPPIRTLTYLDKPELFQLRRKVNNKVDKFVTNSILIARAHVIIGWKLRDCIRSISDLSGRENQVFDTYIHQFITLSSNDLWKLGVDRRLSMVLVNDLDAAKLRPIPQSIHQIHYLENYESNNQALHPALYQPTETANLHGKNQVNYQASFQENYQTNPLTNHDVYGQAYEQGIHTAYYQAHHEVNQGVPHQSHEQSNHQFNYQSIDQAYYQASHQASSEETHPAHHQVVEHANCYAISQAHNQARLQANPQTNPQAYHEIYCQAYEQAYHRYLMENGNN